MSDRGKLAVMKCGCGAEARFEDVSGFDVWITDQAKLWRETHAKCQPLNTSKGDAK